MVCFDKFDLTIVPLRRSSIGVDLHKLVINGVDLHELVINGVLMERDLSYQHIVNIFQYVKVYRLVNGTAYYS